MINRDRLAELFKTLVEIDSVSKHEKALSEKIIQIVKASGVNVSNILFDNAHLQTGGNVGNLILKLPGTKPVPPLLLCGHMDTVEPGVGVKAIFRDGVFTSDGTTILGADDKSAIAIIMEVIHTIVEQRMEVCPLEILFTVCEEIGLQGAKNLDFSLIEAEYGYVLDIGDTKAIVTRAPAANRFEFKIIGKDAHAGVIPEKGINAIALAAEAISKIEMGRIDHETTCNIGLINGGIATNIVPNLVVVKGEVRSHDEQKLDVYTQKVISAFETTVRENERQRNNGLPKIEYIIENDFPATQVAEDHVIVDLARKAAENLGSEIVPRATGGGADANIFFKKGIVTGVIGTGMTDMHTVRESIKLDDMAYAAGLLLEIIKLHSQGNG